MAPAQVAHRRAGRTEQAHGLAQARQDEIGPLGGDLPGAQNPHSPACDGGQHSTAARFAGGVDVQRPATVLLKNGAYLVSTSPMEPGQVRDKSYGQFAYLARGDADALVE